MKASGWLGLLAAGMLLLITGGLWSSLFRGTAGWNLEKAARQSELKDRLHNLGYQVDAVAQRPGVYGSTEGGPVIEEYKRLKAEFDRLNSDLQTAQDRPKTIAGVLKWSGISLALISIVGWYAAIHRE